MPSDDIVSAIAAVVRRIVGDSSVPIHALTTASDVPGWDSLANVQIILGVEAKFGVRLSTREIATLGSVGDLADAVAAKTDQPS